MQIKNKIINYYVTSSYSGGVPRVFRSPITMPSDVAKMLIGKQMTKNGEELSRGDILHVCYDFDSGRIYVPNPPIQESDAYNKMLSAAKLRITNDFGGYANVPPIVGSPYSSIRVRSIASFSHSNAIIKKHYNGKIFNDLPIIEANLDRMPSTVKHLPPMYSQNSQFLGGYIAPSFAGEIAFVEEINLSGKRHQHPIPLHVQKTPFILINMGGGRNGKEPTATEKDWVVLSGYRDYLHDEDAVQQEKYAGSDLSAFADIYDIKRSLYLGWSFEEVAGVMMYRAKSIGTLFDSIDRLMLAVTSLKSEGYKDVSSDPYYISFEVAPDKFPLPLQSIIDLQTGAVDLTNQRPYFHILDYDIKTSKILIRCPVMIPPDVCVKVLGAESQPLICKYNPMVNKIDVKTGKASYEEARMQRLPLLKIKALVRRDLGGDKEKALEFRNSPSARGQWAVDPTVYNIRKVSDYLYACDFIKKMCEKNNMPFQDFTVVVGPIEQLFGQGSLGGFMDANLFKKNKLSIPMQIIEDIYVSPPLIFVNSVKIPSYSEQTETLIHEYRHYLFGLQNPNYEITYKKDPKKRGTDYKFWFDYLTDSNEIAAHKDEIEYELLLGKSIDEIVRNKVGGQITTENYPIALKFREMVEEVMEELEKREDVNEHTETGTPA